MGQTKFGNMLGCFGVSKTTSQSYYRKYENGSLNLSAQQAYDIMQTIKISLKDLLH
jgi:transcriptional regulator with XRE-family HTH domain